MNFIWELDFLWMGRERREENINEGERWEVKKRERGREGERK